MKGVAQVSVTDIEKSLMALLASGKNQTEVLTALNAQFARVEPRRRAKLFGMASRNLQKQAKKLKGAA